jgi:TPR repeat protein
LALLVMKRVNTFSRNAVTLSRSLIGVALITALLLGGCRTATIAPKRVVPSSSASVEPHTSTTRNSRCDVLKLQADCERHHVESCAQLGYCFAHGEGGAARDDRKAVEFYKLAFAGENVSACGNLGFMYAAGRGTARDDKLAFAFYQKACEGGSVGDCTNMASALNLGQGTPKDDQRATRSSG